MRATYHLSQIVRCKYHLPSEDFNWLVGQVPISQGLKAGLAAGVVYGLMVGMLHFGVLEACRTTQLQYIATQIVKQNINATADSLFATDIVYYPMIYGLWSLVYGVIYGAVFALMYLKLPGRSSKRKGMLLAVPVFFIGLFAGPAFFGYQCVPSYIPYIFQIAGLPVAVIFGFVLGVFYDSFGRLAVEQKEEIEKAKKEKP